MHHRRLQPDLQQHHQMLSRVPASMRTVDCGPDQGAAVVGGVRHIRSLAGCEAAMSQQDDQDRRAAAPRTGPCCIRPRLPP